jgi:hypothetical protein
MFSLVVLTRDMSFLLVTHKLEGPPRIGRLPTFTLQPLYGYRPQMAMLTPVPDGYSIPEKSAINVDI